MTNFVGTPGVDDFPGTPADDVATGAASNDLLAGAAGADTLSGDSGNDLLQGGAGADTLYGGDDQDALFSANNVDVILYSSSYPTGGDSGVEVDNLYGGAENDRLYAGYGDNVDGGTQFSEDKLFLCLLGAPSGLTITFNSGTYSIGGGTITGIETVVWVQGTNFADTFSAGGGQGLEQIFGMGGDDQLTAGYRTRDLDGGDGNDTLDGRPSQYLNSVTGGAGDDVLYNKASAFAYGGDGNDTIHARSNVYGGAGDDLVTVEETTLVKGDDGNDQITVVNGLGIMFGGAGADRLTGGGDNDYLFSADQLSQLTPTEDAGVDHDVLIGGGGNDIMAGGYGDDIDGGTGADSLSLSLAGATTGVTLNAATISGGGTTVIGGGTIQSIEALTNLRGSAFDDALTGDGTANIIDGGAGSDTLDGGGGTDTASYASANSAVQVSLASTGSQATGGAGTDTLSNFENLTGSAFDDILEGSSGNNTIDGGAGFDMVSYASASAGVTAITTNPSFGGTASGGGGSDTFVSIEGLIGSAFNDTLTAGYFGAVLDGGLGNDTLNGSGYIATASYAHAAGPVTVSLAISTPQNTGSAGTDTLNNIDNLIGSAFDDVLAGVGGTNNVINGGAGIDTADYSSSTEGLTVNLAASGQNAFRDTLISIENIIGSNFNDTIAGDSGDNILNGGGTTGAGTDVLSYENATAGVVVNLGITTAQNTVGAGTDTVTNFEDLRGSSFNDTLSGSNGNNQLNGGAGIDTVTYATASAGVTVSLALTVQNTVGAGTDALSNFENLAGSSFRDILLGSTGNNAIDGGAGDDQIYGSAGSDLLNGGAGTDTVDFSAAPGAVTVNLQLTAAQTVGAGVGAAVTLTSIERLIGSALNDTLTGDAGANWLQGYRGSDVLYGLAGDDLLTDGAETSNRDFMYGGSGNDTYFVTASYASGIEDLVFEGGTNPDLMAGVGDVDIIHSGGDFFWDFYSVGEVLYNDAATGSPLLVAGKDVLNKTIYGGAGNDRVVTYGHNSVVDLGAGTDAVDFGSYGLDSSYNGQNSLIMRPGTGTDYIYNFHSGTDKVDLTAFSFGITGAQVLAQAVNVDNAGTANDYSYFYLTNAGGVNNFVVFIGLLGSQLQAGDFLT